MGRSRKKLSDQPFELEVTSLDSKGLGLAEFEEKKLKVFDALPGEKVIARYLFGRKNKGKVETLEVRVLPLSGSRPVVLLLVIVVRVVNSICQWIPSWSENRLRCCGPCRKPVRLNRLRSLRHWMLHIGIIVAKHGFPYVMLLPKAGY